MPWIDNFIDIIFIQDFILDLIGIVREGLYLGQGMPIKSIYFNYSTEFIRYPNYTSLLCNHEPIILLLTHMQCALRQDQTHKPAATLKTVLFYVGDRPAATLDGLCFIQYHVLPLDSLEVLDVLDDQLVAGDDHMEGGLLCVQTLLVPELPQDPPVLGVPPVRHYL